MLQWFKKSGQLLPVRKHEKAQLWLHPIFTLNCLICSSSIKYFIYNCWHFPEILSRYDHDDKTSRVSRLDLLVSTTYSSWRAEVDPEVLQTTASGCGRAFCCFSRTSFVISTRFYVSCSVRRDDVGVRHGEDAFVHLLRAFWAEWVTPFFHWKHSTNTQNV